MDRSPETEFEFFLASKLGMTVGELRQRMSNDEFVTWQMFYARKQQREEIEAQKATRR